jgi:hypothetical protein
MADVSVCTAGSGAFELALGVRAGEEELDWRLIGGFCGVREVATAVLELEASGAAEDADDWMGWEGGAELRVVEGGSMMDGMRCMVSMHIARRVHLRRLVNCVVSHVFSTISCGRIIA